MHVFVVSPCVTAPSLPVSQLWTALRRDPLWPRHPGPSLPTRRGRRWQRPQLRPHQQLPPAALTPDIYQSHSLPCSPYSGAQPASGLLRGAGWSLRKGEQAQAPTCSTEPASNAGGQVREGREGLDRLYTYLRGPNSCWPRLDLTSQVLSCICACFWHASGAFASPVLGGYTQLCV